MGRKDKPMHIEAGNSLPIGQLMRHARQNKGISLTKMAVKMGYSVSYLSGIENSHGLPSVRLIKDYEEQLGVKIAAGPNILNETYESNELNSGQDRAVFFQQDVKGWNLWRGEHDEEPIFLVNIDLHGRDLRGVNLSTADLRGANFREADLREADLREADLSNANFTGANLSRAMLSKANLSQVNFYKADLSEADLTEANFTEAKLCKTILMGTLFSMADLSGATFGKTHLGNIDLRQVRGLETLLHLEPSHIELYSTQLPQNGSSLHFLRGCGVPDVWIDYYRFHMMQPLRYYSCFLSYASQDELFAERLHADLQDQGVRCWFAPHDLRIGDKIRQRIDEAIHVQDKLLLLLSEHSIASSWVRNEVELALEKEQMQMRDVLFPLRLDDAILRSTNSWAAHIRRSKHIGDFTKWTDPQEYMLAFEKLLRDLKVS